MKKLDLTRFLRLEVGSVLLILFGMVMVVNPDFGSAAVAAVIGWVLVGAGAAGLLIGVLGGSGLGKGLMVGGVLVLLAGMYLLKHPLMLATILGVMMGILLTGQGIGALRDAIRMKHYGGGWIPGTVLGGIMLLAGVRLIASPMATSRMVMTVAGIVMIVCGVANLVNHHRAEKYIPGPDDIIDAE